MPLFPLLYAFPLKNHDFSTVIPFTDEITKPWTLGLRLVLRTRASDCQQRAIVLRKRSNSVFAYLCSQLSALTLTRNWLENPLFCIEWFHCIFNFIWEAFQVQHLRNKGRYQLR